MVLTLAMVIPIDSREGPLGASLARNPVLLGGEAAAPFVVGKANQAILVWVQAAGRGRDLEGMAILLMLLFRRARYRPKKGQESQSKWLGRHFAWVQGN